MDELMENIIGTIKTAAGISMEPYVVFLTESGIAIYRAGPSRQGAPDTVGLFDRWQKTVIDINNNHKPIVDYSTKQLNNEALKSYKIDFLPNKTAALSIPYDKIRAVNFESASREDTEETKEMLEITFDTGSFSKETILIPSSAVNEVIELIKKTPLASNLKQQ